MGKLDTMKASASLGGRSVAFPPGVDPVEAIRRPAHLEGARADKAAMSIALDRIERDPDQPREEFDPDELGRLAESIRVHGLLQPIRVRWDAEAARYIILTGERRYRAARMAGLAEIQCVVHSAAMSSSQKLGLQLIENALRHDLRPIEQAKAYRALMDANGWTAKEVANELHINPSSMTRALSLLGLPPLVQERVEQGTLSPSAAAEIAKLARPEDQVAVAEAAERENFGRDEVAQVVRAVKARRAPAAAAVAARPEPHEFHGPDGVVLKITWKKPGGPTAVQVLKAALKDAQLREQQARLDLLPEVN